MAGDDMPDDMFFSNDRRSLRRGKRVSKRTETCRPCLVWLKEDPTLQYLGVVLDVNPYGMRIRMMDLLPSNSQVIVQMMRDEEFRVPLARPIEATVVRHQDDAEGMVDHGVRIIRKQLRQSGPNRPVARGTGAKATPTTVYTLDVTVGDEAGPDGMVNGMPPEDAAFFKDVEAFFKENK